MKRKISFLLSLIMILSAFGTLNVKAANNIKFDDVDSETPHYAAIMSMVRMGIINGYDEDGKRTFKPNDSITRAEFTAIITRAMGVGDIDSGTTVFPDAQDSWARGNIQVAYDMKIVNGYEDGTFRPENKVTYEEVVKMLVCTLGYEPQAKALGGWSIGYIAEAGKLGITKDVTVLQNDTPAPRGDVVQLMYNCLDIELMQVDSDTSTSEKKQTFMEKYLKMKKDKGILVGVGSDVTAQCPKDLGTTQMCVLVKDNYVYLDFSEFTENKADISKYLGQTVTVWYKTDVLGSDDILVDIGTEVTKNTVLEIPSDKLARFKDSKIVYYDDNDREKSYKVDFDTTTFLYNNVILTDNVEEKLSTWFDEKGENIYFDDPDRKMYGSVKITDSGSKGVASLVEIKDYRILVSATTPTSSDYMITNKYKLKGEEEYSVILDPNGDKDFTITLDGTKSDVLSLKTNDVVLVAESEDETHYEVLATRNVVEGTITEYYAEDKEVVINSKRYKLHERFVQYAKEQNYTIKSGANVKFYVDSFGNVVYGSVTSSQTISPYAFILNADQDSENEDKCFVRILTTNNKFETYYLKDKVNYNGSSISAESAVARLNENAHNVVDVDGKECREFYMDADLAGIPNVKEYGTAQIARVGITNNVVSSITTETRAIGQTTAEQGELMKYMDCKKSHYSSANTFNNAFYTNSNTTVIYVPSDRQKSGDYARKTPSAAFTTDTLYYVEAYNVNESKVADLVLVYNQTSSGTPVQKSTYFSVVERFGETGLYDDVPTLELPYFTSSTTRVKTFIGNSKYEDLMPGDLFRTGKNKDGNLDYLQDVITCDSINEVLEDGVAKVIAEEDNPYSWTDSKFNIKTNSEDYMGYARGEIALYNVIENDVEGGTIRLTRKGFTLNEDGDYVLPSDGERRFTTNDKTVVLKYDSAKNQVSPYVEGTETNLTVNNIQDAKSLGTRCSKVALFNYSGNVRMIVIYE